MATACLRCTLQLSKTIKITDAVHRVSHYQPATCQLVSVVNQTIVARYSSFFSKKDAEAMWDSATGVSNAGRKRGRSSRGKLPRRINLNIGQKMGHGKTGLIFPGLSTNISGKERLADLGVRRQEKTETDTTGEDAAKSQNRRSMFKVDALDRGYTGRKLAGRKIGPPDPVGDNDFSDFDAYVIENKLVGHVTGNQGKVYQTSVIVAVGNGKGLIGIALGKASTSSGAISAAKNKAAQRLVYVDIYNNHTPLHNFTEKYHKTSVIVKQAPKGEGLHCHPALKLICKLIGIKDIYVKTEGKGRNYWNLCHAFIDGILKTRSHQDIADELGHHIVEYHPEKDNYPVVVASPSENAPKTDFKKQDGFTFESYCFGNRLPLNKPSKKPFYWRYKCFQKKRAQQYTRRNQPKARFDRMALGFQSDFHQRLIK